MLIKKVNTASPGKSRHFQSPLLFPAAFKIVFIVGRSSRRQLQGWKRGETGNACSCIGFFSREQTSPQGARSQETFLLPNLRKGAEWV